MRVIAKGTTLRAIIQGTTLRAITQGTTLRVITQGGFALGGTVERDGVCDVMRDTYGYGTALANNQYATTSLSVSDQDAECCNHCHERQVTL